MFNHFPKVMLNATFHLQLLKSTLLVTNAVALIIYTFMHCIFYDFPFIVLDEIVTLIKLFSTASLFAIVINFIILLADAVDFLWHNRKQMAYINYLKQVGIVILLVSLLFISCSGPIVNAGIKKDFNTGMSSSYVGMEPEKVFLVMNNEVLNHTDIPIGESFLVINDGVKGMTAKNGKVKLGCTLTITDQQDKILLNEKDLFAGHDEFEEKDAKLLKCTVNTGSPMKWEEKYNVAVTFWDKNGTGKIENKVTIRCIDIP